jgi:hypothetical protein
MTTIRLRKGWEAKIVNSGEGTDIILRNPTDDGEGRKFFEITTVGDPYGAPRVVQEPSLGIPARDAGIDVDGNLVGFVVVRDGEIVERASLSNLVYMKESTVRVSEDGELFINDESKGYIQLIFNPDKNRLIGLVAFIGADKPDQVKVLEMEEAALALLG